MARQRARERGISKTEGKRKEDCARQRVRERKFGKAEGRKRKFGKAEGIERKEDWQGRR